ncbi:nuclear transport factor 2 family protein [Pseudooceanicola sp. MF1-13]|uniref:nuclear transport factor 2 family protein n=1 Tax=Pseudooceanicola sp. MF1-13 TaxID=3379095 RepID=UPI003892C083
MLKHGIQIAAAVLSMQAGMAIAQSERDYPTTFQSDHAAPETAQLFDDVFRAKSTGQAEEMMSNFSTDMVGYCDTTLGWPCKTHAPLVEAFKGYMPKWVNGLSYPIEVLGGPESAIVYFIDTPELFGSDLRVIGVVDIRDGKIVRWADYWDSSAYPVEGYNKLVMPPEKFNTDYLEGKIEQRASDKIIEVSNGLAEALASGDKEKLDALMAYDVVLEDAALRTQIVGEPAVQAYLDRALSKLPYGAGLTVRHVVGGDLGGGFEWTSGTEDAVKHGVAALTLDDKGKISRITMVYNGRLLDSDLKRELILLSAAEI